MITFFEDKHLYCKGRPAAPRPDLLVPSVTFILRRVGACPPVRPYMRRALARGRAVHKAIELFLLGKLDLPSVDAKLMPYFECFLDWYEKHCPSQFTRLRPEVVLEGAHTLVYGGKADVLAWEKGLGTDAVIDWKTGEEEEWHLIQDTLYCLADNRMRGRGASPFVVYLWPKKGWKCTTPLSPGATTRRALSVLEVFDLGRKRHMAALEREALEEDDY